MRRPRPFGPYLLLYRIASGGMAEMYRARVWGAADEREVALKRPLPVYNDDEEFIVMLTDEARITALFDHPNITRTIEFGVVDRQYFLAMEYVSGVDLRGLIRRSGERREALPATTAAWIVEQALRGLHHAHETCDADGRALGLVHRDFSPSNILVGDGGAVKLTDFGIAKARFNKARTRAGFIKGKVRYMSPEQSRSETLDRRSDVFAAGVVLYFAMTGRMPFRGDDDNAVMRAVRTGAAHPPSAIRDDLDPAFDGIVARALAKDPADRHPTAAAFADALGRWRATRSAIDEPAASAALVRRMFARELNEADALYHSFDERAIDALTPTGSGATYTRLVGQDSDDTPVDGGGSDPAESELLDEIDSWLNARRAAPDAPGGAGDAWTADHRRPGWADAAEQRSDAKDTAPGVPAALVAHGVSPADITGSTVDESASSGISDSADE